MYERHHIRRSLDALYTSASLVLPDMCCLLPPCRGSGSGDGPIHQRYMDIKNHMNVSERDHARECSLALQKTIEMANDYIELLTRFLGQPNVYLIENTYREVGRNLEAMGRIEADWMSSKRPEWMSPALWPKLRSLIRYQREYSVHLKDTSESIVRAGRLITENDPCWKKAEDIYRFLRFSGKGGGIDPDDKADAVLVSVAVAMALETGKRARIFSVDLDTEKLLHDVLSSDCLNAESKAVLGHDRSSVGICYIGADIEDLVVLADSARLARGDPEIRKRGKEREASRRFRIIRDSSQ